jgi:beta-glucosidase
VSERVDALVAQLTLEEKVSLLAGTDWWHTPAIERLGIPPIKMSDGPAGVRGAHVSGGPPSASFPCGTALGATWDVDLIRRVGLALAAELKSKGGHLLLAPTVNLHRTPLAGRNFECYSEDPHLTARLAVAYIEGLQGEGVGATVKHFVANDSEFERMTISSEVPERALRELYLLPFEYAVREAGSWAIMSAYNKVAGTWCSENPGLLTTILRDEWGFDGLVVSDWFGTHTTVDAALAGLDLEMPGPPQHRGELLVKAVRDGDVPEVVIDARARRVLQLAERAGVLDGTAADPTAERYDDDADRRALLREAAASSIVLLRNEPLAASGAPLLPLARDEIRSIAVIGPTASAASSQGGGSAQVPHPYAVSPLDGLVEGVVGRGVTITHEPGATIARGAARLDPTRVRTAAGGRGIDVEYFAGDDLDGDPVQRSVDLRSWFRWDPQFVPAGPGRPWSVRLSTEFTPAYDGEHSFSVRTAGRVRLWVGDSVAVDSWDAAEGRRTVGGSLVLEAGVPVEVRVEWAMANGDVGLDLRVLEPLPDDLADRAVAAAAAADVAVVVVGMDSTWETEGRDRADLTLPGGQAALVERVAAANPRTVVVVNTGAPVEMGWVDAVPAVLQLWYPGQEGGNALADVLTGRVGPSGRLPTTFPHRLEDIPAYLNYPGERGEVHYGEGLFIGYRAFDKTGLAPRFPFGHGLTYTSFSYGPIELSATTAGPGRDVEVSVPVTNTGAVAGAEVVQLYVADRHATVVRPPTELKGFARVSLEPGETGTARFTLGERAFAFWDPSAHDWVVEPGEFELLAAASAADIRSRATLVWEA